MSVYQWVIKHAMCPAKVKVEIFAGKIQLRLYTHRTDERPVIRSAQDAAHLMRDMADLHQEHVRVILLDTSQRIIAISTVYIGL